MRSQLQLPYLRNMHYRKMPCVYQIKKAHSGNIYVLLIQLAGRDGVGMPAEKGILCKHRTDGLTGTCPASTEYRCSLTIAFVHKNHHILELKKF